MAREVFSKVFQDNEINVTSSKVVQGWVIFFILSNSVVNTVHHEKCFYTIYDCIFEGRKHGNLE